MGRFLEIGMGIKSGKVHPSTLQSLEKGKKTEIDIMNGYLAAKGLELGVPTPVNSWMTETIREIEDGKRPISRKNIWDLGRRFYRIF
jgi:2-dehydropantoate 2-reductase